MSWLREFVQDFSMSLRDRPLQYFISYPKVGATWLKYMLCEIIRRSNPDQTFDPTVELTAMTQRVDHIRQIIWTHDGASPVNESGKQFNPKDFFVYGGKRRYAKGRVLLMVRDPRDAVVSCYHQVTRRTAKPLQIKDMSTYIRDPYLGFDRILYFYDCWYRQRHVPQAVKIVRYEDLMEQGSVLLADVCAYFGLAASSEIIEAVFEDAKPDKMRKAESQGEIVGMRSFGDDINSMKVRKARSGTYQEEMSPEDIDFCNARMKRFCEQYGYEC